MQQKLNGFEKQKYVQSKYVTYSYSHSFLPQSSCHINMKI